ncbi:MauE/DoxX family redox-associated membrane protein [Paenibacillus sp. NAIST15-1]|uniref:MauE/DoxX family redox-associated membrane protein n=1 Tax=Paenibacillus sp. NAIST15-1 TaxID=1605994 RepID=UPI00086D6182|nr:MauE/DoxX family redox-associated membrane protein [Paenibacillus sp. NAIST15-1]GAV10958.1 methylamine utilization protein MauE [Paenibacillus sp. NAIST15-1]
MGLEAALSIFLCTILVYSSIAKLVSYRDFKKTVQQLNFPSFTAWGVIVFELLVTVLLVFDTTHFAGAVGSLLLFGSFYFVAGKALWDKKKITCNCFGKTTEEQLGWGTMLRNTPFFAASLLCIWLHSPASMSGIAAIEWISVAGITIGLINVYTLWNNRSLLS